MKKISKNILLVLCILLTGNSYAQNENADIDLVIGASIPTVYHVGAGLHYIPNARLDFSFGSDFIDDANGRLYALTANHAIYFGKVNTKAKRRLWSVNTGITFLVEENPQIKSTAAYFNLFFARKFPIVKKLFIQPEIGASNFLFEHLVDVDDIVTQGTRTRFIPKIGINLILGI